MSWRNSIATTDTRDGVNSALEKLSQEIKKQAFVDQNAIALDLKKQLTPHWKESIKDQGPKGDKGDVGPMGPLGPKGDKGDSGIDGKDGVDGKSIQGPAGKDGADGATWHLVNEKPDSIGADGDFCLNKSSFEMFHKENGEWISLGSIKGKSAQSWSTGSGSTIQFQDEGVNLGGDAAIAKVDFTGSGVTASRSGDKITVAISGGGGGGGNARVTSTVAVNTAAANAASTDYLYIVTNGSTITLPTAVSNTNLYTIKRTGSSAVMIATTGGQTIDGSATASLNLTNESRQFYSDGANWVVI